MVSYEESRKKRVEENKKRMEQLNLHGLSQSLNNSPSETTTNTNTNKRRKNMKRSSDLGVISVRRSSRTVDKPPPNYKEFYPLDIFAGRPRHPHRRLPKDDFYASAEEKAYAIDRADHLQSTLPSQFPSFVKPLLKSHVSGGFWLPHLPDQDVKITLLDEDDQPWEVTYLAYKNGLSGGWRTFSIDHNLRDGDALVFQLVQPLSFKVHIICVVSDEQEQNKGPSESDEAVNATELRTRKRSKRE